MSTRKTFSTEKGTELPLMSLKGKEYLQVAHRLVWFREKYPNGVLKTQMIETNGEGKDRFYIFRTEVFIDTDRGPMLIATGHKRETVGDFPDAMEKAETGSIGRALALAGFGTQFTADELDEKNRLADAPVEVVTGEAAADNVSATVSTGRRSSFRKNVSAVAAVAANTSGDDI